MLVKVVEVLARMFSRFFSLCKKREIDSCI